MRSLRGLVAAAFLLVCQPGHSHAQISQQTQQGVNGATGSTLALQPSSVTVTNPIVPGGATLISGSTYIGTPAAGGSGFAAGNYMGCTDHVNASLLSTNFDCLQVAMNLNSNLVVGSHNALAAALLVSAQTGNFGVTATPNYVGARFVGQCAVNDGGGTGTEYGACFGADSFGWLSGSATHWNSVFGHEIDVEADAGTSVLKRVGLLVVDQNAAGGTGVTGSTDDDGIDIDAQNSAPGFNCAICVGNSWGWWPVPSTGTIIGAVGNGNRSPVANIGIDFSSVVFSSFIFKAPNFNVTSGGVLTAGGVNANSAITAATWGNNGILLTSGTNTFTDNTASGTIANEAINAMGAGTLTTPTNSITVTNLTNLFVAAPIAGTHVTATNTYAAFLNGNVLIGSRETVQAGANIFGGVTNLNASSNFATNIGTGTTTSTVAIGGGSNAVTVTATAAGFSAPNVTTGTNTDFVCMAAGNVFTLQTSACTISSRRFKQDIKPLATKDALAEVLKMRPVTFRMKPTAKPNKDPNFLRPQSGLIAEEVAAIDPKLAIYEDDLKTPKSYRQEAIIADLVGAVKAEQAEIAALKAQVAELEHRAH